MDEDRRGNLPQGQVAWGPSPAPAPIRLTLTCNTTFSLCAWTLPASRCTTSQWLPPPCATSNPPAAVMYASAAPGPRTPQPSPPTLSHPTPAPDDDGGGRSCLFGALSARGTREAISRGLASGLSMRAIALELGRHAARVSREIGRNGGYAAYRATRADKAAWERALRWRLPPARGHNGGRGCGWRGADSPSTPVRAGSVR